MAREAVASYDCCRATAAVLAEAAALPDSYGEQLSGALYLLEAALLKVERRIEANVGYCAESRGCQMRYDTGKIQAEADEIRIEEDHKAAWNRFCENCGELLEDDKFWIDVRSRHPDDDDPIKVQYCRKCIKIDQARTRETRGPSARS